MFFASLGFYITIWFSKPAHRKAVSRYLQLLTKKISKMKVFFKENWFKIIVGISMFTFSIGFSINSLTSLKAAPIKTNYKAYKVGDLYMTGCGIDQNYAYFVSFQVDDEDNDYYFKVPLSKFKLLPAK